MDTLIIQDLKLKPKINFTQNDRFLAEVLVGGICVGTSEAAYISTENTWLLDVIFLVPTMGDTFGFIFYQVDDARSRERWGAINVTVEPVALSSAVEKRGFIIQLQTATESTEVADVKFSTVLSTSNYSAKNSAPAVIQVVKDMASETLLSFLTELTMSDPSCVNADTAILHAAYSAVAALLDDGTDKPRALTLLANVHVFRYDVYLQVAEEEATTQPMYSIYLVGLKLALRLLKDAVSLAAEDRSKKTWMLISLSLCIQRFIVLDTDNFDAFKAHVLYLMGVVSNIPDEEPQKSQLLNFLGSALRDLFTKSGDRTFVDTSVETFEHAIRLAADDTPKSSLLMELADSLLIRFGISGRIIDISTSLKRRFESLVLIPDDDGQKPMQLNSLGYVFFTKAKSYNDIEMTTKSIEAYETALLLIQDIIGHPERSSILNNLAASIQLRSEQLGVFASPTDLQRFKQLMEDAVASCPPNDPKKISYLLNFARALLQYQHPIALADEGLVDKFISVLDAAVTVIEDADEDYVSSLNKAAYSFLSIYEDIIQTGAFDVFFSLHDKIISLLPDIDTDKSIFLYKLASAMSRVPDSDRRSYLDKTISTFECAAHIHQGIEPPDVLCLVNHGTAYLKRFADSEDPEDLNNGIEILEQVVGNPRELPSHIKLSALNDLSLALFSRFILRKNFEDLDRGISALEDAAFLAVSTLEEDISSYSKKQFDLLVEYSEKFTDISDLDVVILALRAEVDLFGDGTSGTRRLQNLGTYFSIRLKRLGNSGNIPASVLDELAYAAEHIPDSNTRKGLWLNMAGSLLSRSFKFTADASDINRAIGLSEKALQYGQSSYFDSCNHLGCSLLTRFRSKGELCDINKAINTFHDALKICPEDHGMRYSLLANLATSLLDRYLHLGDISDFNQAAMVIETARNLDAQEADKSDVIDGNTAVMLTYRTEMMGDPESTNEAIRIWENKSKSGSTSTDTLLGHATALLHRFRILHDVADVDVALKLIGQAEANDENESMLDYPKAHILNNRASAHAQRFVQLGAVEDIDCCIAALRQAADLTPNSHPLKSSILFDLGRWLPARYEVVGDVHDLDDSFEYLSACALTPTAPVRLRFRAASLWAHFLKYFDRGQSLRAYSLSMDLLPQLAWLGHSIAVRQSRLLEASHVAVNAVAAAVEASQYDTAVEWLEAGRGIVWSQVAELRSPVDGLQDARPDLSSRFRELSQGLEGDHSSESTTSLSKGATPRYHDLAHERNQLVDEIRTLDGFDNFLRPRKIDDFFPCTDAGPVVAINVSQYRCDALALIPGSDKVRHIPLEQFTATDASALLVSLRTVLRKRGFLPSDRGIRTSLAKKRSRDSEIIFEDILAKLWTCVAKPILDGLGYKWSSTGKDLPHIHWCLTGPLASLPLHASGLYTDDSPGSKLSDFIVSSYIPSISILVNNMRSGVATHDQILAIALPVESELPRVMEEIDAIAKITSSFPMLRLIDSQATVENVVKGMQTSSYVHFACHGIQGTLDPIDTALLLSEHTQLSLSEIAKLDVAHGQLAYLSACQTATGDDLLAEQSFHLAAGLLSAGYRGAIATMWSISDDDAPIIAEQVYHHLLHLDTDGRYVLDSSRAAYALALAVEHLRKRSADRKSLFLWIPFIHVGI